MSPLSVLTILKLVLEPRQISVHFPTFDLSAWIFFKILTCIIENIIQLIEEVNVY